MQLTWRNLLLRIQFAEIPEEGLLVNVNDASWFPDKEVARRGDPKAEVFLERSGERVLAAGFIDVVLLLTCDRCLAGFASPHKIDFRLVLEVAAAEEDQAEEMSAGHEYDSGEVEVVALDGPIVDLGDLLYQQMLLALPRKVLCRSDCRGICRRCGADLNVEFCKCPDSSGGSSFAVLGELLINKK